MDTTTSTLILAIVAAVIASAVTPLVLASIANAKMKAERAEDRADREAVAAHVLLVAKQSREAAEVVAQKVEAVAVEAKGTTATINEIHTIVNQQRTEMMDYISTLSAALRSAGVQVPGESS